MACHQKEGWIDRDLFHQWFAFHFLRYAPQERPLLLLLDGHSSHFCPETVHLADEHDIVVFILPPNLFSLQTLPTYCSLWIRGHFPL